MHFTYPERCRTVLTTTTIIIFTVASATPARAIDKIYSPHVVKGEAELEYFGTRTLDNNSSKNNAQAHEFSVGYGVTDWWQPEFYGVFEKEPEDSAKLIGFEFENRFQLTEPGEYWVDPGLLAAYTFGIHGEPNELEIKILLEKQTGKFLHRVNAGFDEEIGHGAEGGAVPVAAWSTRYRYNLHFEPGFEIQSDFGHRENFRHFDEQEHYVGPALYGQVVPNLKYEAAYLFGISNETSSGAARLLLEYEKFF